jgi:pimeloyl-ACP methyl ester carboxylesterase
MATGEPSQADSGAADPLVPIPTPVPLAEKASSFLKMAVAVPLGLVAGSVLVTVFAIGTLTGINPLIEWCLSKQDDRALDRDSILREHTEMFLLEIPGNINKASAGKSYQVMVRLTKPSEAPETPLPPVIFPGGLMSNLMTMSKHQNELTEKHGFTVVNFDRLGVGFSDPHPPDNTSPSSAADVAREMDYVMTNCRGIDSDAKWIQVGGSMGTNVATAFVTLFPNRLCGFFNLDGLPHAFLQIQCKKFVKDGPALMNTMRRLRWTLLPRLAFNVALRPMVPVIGDAFTPAQLVGVMCRDQFFVASGFEYATLMSCCDLECAAWGAAATTEYDSEMMRVMASLAPDESVIVNEAEGLVPRTVTEERSASELGVAFLSRNGHDAIAIQPKLRSMGLRNAKDIDKTKTYCNWPDAPNHPAGEFIGGVDANTTIHPLATEFEKMVVRAMCARDYKGLESAYTQTARNHAAARTTLHVLMSGDGKSYYYPRLNHMNLWQQVAEVVGITHEIAQVVRDCSAQGV